MTAAARRSPRALWMLALLQLACGDGDASASGADIAADATDTSVIADVTPRDTQAADANNANNANNANDGDDADAADVSPPDGSASDVPDVTPGDEVAVAFQRLVGGPTSPKPSFTLYVFDDNLAAPGTSTCIQGCRTGWPPLLVADGLASGVADLGTIARADGGAQATHMDRPLYFYIGDSNVGDHRGDDVAGWHSVSVGAADVVVPLYDATTPLEPIASFVRDDGVVVTRVGDRGRDRHAKEQGPQDHYNHYLAHYWEYRTARIQLEDFVPTGESRIRASFITEEKLGAREFRVWYWGNTTPGQFHFNPQKEEAKVNPNEPGVVYMGQGTWDDDFVKVSDDGHQHLHTLDIVTRWENGGQAQLPLTTGTNMEFEVSQFLLSPPAGDRLNYYGTSFVYVIGEPGLAPFEWQRGVNNPGGANDGTPIPAKGLSGGRGTLGYNYTAEPAGRFMQMATNLSPGNAQPFVRGRRVHHTNFVDGRHDERDDNPVWPQQVGKAGEHYIHRSCAGCRVRNGRALLADPGDLLDQWVFKVGDAAGAPDPLIGRVLQPRRTGLGATEGSVTLGAWTELDSGLRTPNYVFTPAAPARFSARIAPQLVGLGLIEAIAESDVVAMEDPDDADGDGISGRAARVEDPVTGAVRLGRFGYKAAASSVRHQAAAALNTDIGVMTSALPLPDCGSAQADCGPPGSELDDAQLDDLVTYLSLLGVGARRDYADTAGETVFADIGCASCHRPAFTTSAFHPLAELRSQAIHPYTDLLLHDMGEGLADTLGEGSASGAEWRTTPLWGLGHARAVMVGDAKADDAVSLASPEDAAERVGYLHDGRARTLDEAIRWHGGEALASKQAYDALDAADEAALLAFLNSL